MRSNARKMKNSGDPTTTTTITSADIDFFAFPDIDFQLPYMSVIMFLNLCNKVKQMLQYEPPLLEIQSPITIVGDIHGQLQDLLTIFAHEGMPPNRSYLFLGDYVSRGCYSVEVITFLFSLKMLFPSHIYLLRGTHESLSISQVRCGFSDEVMQKYRSRNVWRKACSAFDSLPLAALIDGKIFAAHGGIGPYVETLSVINDIPKEELPYEGPMVDLLFGQPSEEKGYTMSERGAGFNFGPDVTRAFLAKNNLSLLIRSFQVYDQGFMWHHDKKCLTIFSAANYTYTTNNLGGILRIDDESHITIIRLGSCAPSNTFMSDIGRHGIMVGV